MKKLVTLCTVILTFILLLLPSIGCGTTPAGKIAFVGSYEDAPDYSFFIMNADGSNQIELAPAHHAMFPPHQYLSPDGTRLVNIESSRVTHWLSLIDADSGNQRKLVDLPELVPMSMSWAPDGKKIIMGCVVGGEAKVIDSKIQERHYHDIFTVDVETGELNRLTDTLYTQEVHPLYSPDGNTIGYISSDRDPSTWEITSCGIYVMNADGTNQARLITDLGLMTDIGGFCWSPDGKKIAYDLYIEGEGKKSADIYLLDVESTSCINLTNSPNVGDYAPSWSPDGKKIAFCSYTTGDSCQLWTMDADGNNKIKLFDIPRYRTGFPSWSPDGSKIVFTDRQNIYSIDADGKNLRTLVKGEGTYRDISGPIWWLSS